MENVLSISKTGQRGQESLRTHFGDFGGEKCPILKARIELPNLTTEQFNEAMDAITEDS